MSHHYKITELFLSMTRGENSIAKGGEILGPRVNQGWADEGLQWVLIWEANVRRCVWSA